MRIRALPAGERPRERCLRHGPAALSAVELLALVAGGGCVHGSGLALSMSLLSRHASLNELARVSPNELRQVRGIGPARACALAAAFELGRRAERAEPPRPDLVAGPADVVELLRRPLDGLGQEGVCVLSLGARQQALGVRLVALGGLNSAAVSPREVFREAIGLGAQSIVLAHNHPSGLAEPSDDDVRLTRRLVTCGQTLGIEVLDHLVFGAGEWVSLRERGQL